jgi:NADH-quinone oxidoreductase subunit C
MAEGIVETIREELGSRLQEMRVHSPRRVYLTVAPEDLVEAARTLFEKMGARYSIATGTQLKDGFEVIHHFVFDADHVVVSLRARTDSSEPEFDSLAPYIKGAGLIEREIHDLVGILFRGHPNMGRLILSDDWPEGVYPLRRGKPWEGKVSKSI